MAFIYSSYNDRPHRAPALNLSSHVFRDCVFFCSFSDNQSIFRDSTNNSYPNQGGFGSASWVSVPDYTQGLAGRVTKYDGAAGTATLQFTNNSRMASCTVGLTLVLRANIVSNTDIGSAIFTKFLTDPTTTPSFQLASSLVDATKCFAQVHGVGGSNDTAGDIPIPYNKWATYTLRWANSASIILTTWNDDGKKISEATGTAANDTIQHQPGNTVILGNFATQIDFAGMFRRSLTDRELAQLIARRNELLARPRRRERLKMILATGLFPPFRQGASTLVRM